MRNKTYIYDQIHKLKNHQLIIPNDQTAYDFLNQVSLYRIYGYIKTLKANNNINQISIDQIIKIYNFDSELRALLMEILGFIEVLFKTQITQYLANQLDPLCYRDPLIYEDHHKHQQLIKDIDNNLKRKYKGDQLPKPYPDYNLVPIWIIIDQLSFGSASMLYSNLTISHQVNIAKSFMNLNYLYLKNHMYVLTNIRNHCAHVLRLYGHPFNLAPKISNKDKKILNHHGITIDGSSHKIFVYIYVMMKYLEIPQQDLYLNKLASLINNYQDVLNLNDLGFVKNWQEILNIF